METLPSAPPAAAPSRRRPLLRLAVHRRRGRVPLGTGALLAALHVAALALLVLLPQRPDPRMPQRDVDATVRYVDLPPLPREVPSATPSASGVGPRVASSGHVARSDEGRRVPARPEERGGVAAPGGDVASGDAAAPAREPRARLSPPADPRLIPLPMLRDGVSPGAPEAGAGSPELAARTRARMDSVARERRRQALQVEWVTTDERGKAWGVRSGGKLVVSGVTIPLPLPAVRSDPRTQELLRERAAITRQADDADRDRFVRSRVEATRERVDAERRIRADP